MQRFRSVSMGLLGAVSMGALRTSTIPRFKGLASIVVSGGPLKEAVAIDSADDLRTICRSMRVMNGAWLSDSTLPPAAKIASGAIYLTFYGGAIRADTPGPVHVGVVRPPAEPGALAAITILPTEDGVAGPEQLCSFWVEDRPNPNAAPAVPGQFVITNDGVAVLRRYGIIDK